MRYRILGTAQALRPDGTPVPVGGARLRALLTVLALRPARMVPVSVLVDEVWGGEPPAGAAGALQALVARLRRAIGADAVVSLAGGYQLAARADDVDAYRFERLAAEGARALADGDAPRAADVLDDALALWHGPALADLPDRIAEAARWETRRHDAHTARLAAALALGRAEQALPELTALCNAHPLDEPLQALRLRALRDAGRPAAALAGYADVSRALTTRLGTDPGPELRRLHTELLRPPAPRAEPEQAPDPATRPAPATARRPPSPATATPPAPALPPAPPPGNLRARLTSFVGREGEIEAIRAGLAGARLITLLGPGGAGKTRLSQEAADAMAQAMPDGVWLAELAPVDDPDAVPEAVVSALGARETVLRGAGAEELRVAADRHADDPLVRLVEYCAGRRMLLVLDNCEHVVAAAARLAAELLERCPGLTVLATSREPLGVPGESLYPVEPLPEPVALRLLAERGAAARPTFRVADDPEAAAEICRRLDGLPLAIELAAARLRLLTPRQIADRLDDRFQLLTNGARTVLPRQQTLRAVVDWSWELLDTAERAVLRRLSVFAGGCDLAAAEAVCGSDALHALGSLVDKSLVVAAPAPGGRMRYRLLETVAEYAAERLDEAADRAGAERAHLVHFRELARRTDPRLRGPEQADAIAVLSADYENLRTALRCAIAGRDEQEALCLVLSLCWYWQIHDLRHESRTWSKAAAALGPNPFAAPVTPAEPLYERCTDTPPPMRPEVLAEARRGVHLVEVVTRMDAETEDWRTPQAQAKLRAITETYGPGLPQTCRIPGSLWFFTLILTEGLDSLRNVLDETIRTCRALGYRWELAAALQVRANLLANRSDTVGGADRDADESLRIFTALGDTWGTAEALSARGEARERKGDYAGAIEDYQAAIERTEQFGARSQVAVLTTRVASALIETGEEERGEAMLRAVVAAPQHTGNEAMHAGRLFLAMLLGRTGRTDEAREQLRLLRKGFSQAGSLVFDGFVAGLEAWLYMVGGEHERGLVIARRAMERSLDPLPRTVAPQLPSLIMIIGSVALSAMDGGARARDAARLLGAAHRLLPPGHCPSVLEGQVTDQATGVAQALLGAAEYAAAHAEGGALSLEEAAALL